MWPIYVVIENEKKKTGERKKCINKGKIKY